ncbi:MAG: ADP-ribosylglycohydrolase family protein [Actinomycetota bacterium]
MKDRYRGAMVGTAIGDALGAPVEGQPTTRSYVDSLDRELPGLTYTDDTAMTIGVAESLLESGGFDGHHLAHTFARHYAAEPWRGYGASPPEIFGKLERGVPWNEAAATLFGGSGSFGNGAAMRVAPVALFAHPDTHTVASLARQTAIVTHTHPEGGDGAVCQAVAVDRLLGRDLQAPLGPVDLIQEIQPYLTTAVFQERLTYLAASTGHGGPLEAARVLGSGISAPTSVPTALACVLAYPRSFPDAVKAAISLGGDTDTIAAMTGALSGAYLGMNAVPAAWRRVEGHDLLIDLADRLYAHHVTR